ncbi:MAG: protoglobin domain-containing protein [Nostocaceae cyanobacterium]|nr:protoglobin domain-containing protein [Nostocaceae cyanobacterium]
MTLDPHAFMTKMKKRVYFTPQEGAILKSQADWGLKIAPEMAIHFYDFLGRDPEMAAILNAEEGRVHRLRQTFMQWFHEMFTGIDDWGDAYADRRWKIGIIHVRIGIGPQHVVPAMAKVIQEVLKKLHAESKPPELHEALMGICMIDLAFIEQAYAEVSKAAILNETGWSEGLFRRLVITGANATDM